MDALQERKMWKEQLSQNTIPSDVLQSVLLYKQMSSNPDFRATRYLEHLGECALRLHELLVIDNSQQIPDQSDFKDELLYRSMEDALEVRKEIIEHDERYRVPDSDV